MTTFEIRPWSNAQRLLEILSSLSCRTGNLEGYLHQIARGVSELLAVDWSVVTLCEDGMETVMASSLDMGEHSRTYPLHGRLVGFVVASGRSLVVDDALRHPEFGRAPSGYRAYLGVPLRTPQGEVIGTICSFHGEPRDFTEKELRVVELFAERAAVALDNYRLYRQARQFQTRLEDEVRERTEELRTAQAQLVERERLAAIGEFAASIVHEIRNPLTTITCVLRYFEKLALSEAGRERLALAVDEGRRLEHLLGEILLYARPQVLRLADLDLALLVREVVEEFGLRGQAMAFAACPPVPVHADADKLKQVLLNLGQNACEAAGADGRVTWSLQAGEPGWVHLQVHNSGAPIPPEHLERLSEPFFSTKPGGTGLGLAIVRRIVEAHGGRLSIRSAPVEGTTVCVALPRATLI